MKASAVKGKEQISAAPKTDGILIKGARVHNLKNITVEIPRNNLIVVTGVSGSGKSSLTIDTLFAEGQRRYAESLSAYARQFMARMNKPDVDYIKGIAPAIAIEQKVITSNPRSTVGETGVTAGRSFLFTNTFVTGSHSKMVPWSLTPPASVRP